MFVFVLALSSKAQEQGRDTVRPSLTFTAPSGNARLSNATVTATGKASDNRGLAEVWLRLNDGEWQLADGTTNWAATLQLTAGTNWLRAFTVDWAGNRSLTNSRSFFLVVNSVLTLQVWGDGTVMEVSERGTLMPYLDGQPREVGRSYTVRALAGPGNLFAGWSGDLESGQATLTFSMRDNLSLQGNFIPNPFIGLKGSYNGLFYEADEIRHQSSGLATFSLTDRGTFTAKLQSGNKRYPFVGQFAFDGGATNLVARAGTNALTVVLALDMENEAGQISGRVSDGNWIADLKADRAVSNAAMPPPFAGNYTVLLPASEESSSPAGDGYGTVSVASSGYATFKGSLAERTVLTQRAPLSADGYWPLYTALYSGQGSILGWVTFRDDPTTDLAGRLHWIKPVMPTARYYPGGFISETVLVGSRYVPPVGTTNRVLSITNAIATFSGGNLSTPFSNEVTLAANNSVSNASANKLVLTITKPSGLFKGTVVDPTSGKALTFQGALLQKQQAGSGFFLGTNQSGRVYFGP